MLISLPSNLFQSFNCCTDTPYWRLMENMVSFAATTCTPFLFEEVVVGAGWTGDDAEVPFLMVSCCPMDNVLSVRLFHCFISSTVTPYIFEIENMVSFAMTV